MSHIGCKREAVTITSITEVNSNQMNWKSSLQTCSSPDAHICKHITNAIETKCELIRSDICIDEGFYPDIKVVPVCL